MLDLQAAYGLKLKFDRNGREVRLSDNDDPADPASRLEDALERIAALAARRPMLAAGVDAADVAARLDAVIAQLRAALGESSE
jgi:hypothetical protein